ncbi:MAG TPA: hypothetical protein VKV27_11020 [Solirubrobacteraceae bacterium]|nr:hypothetical protein [Solirubrobacteraceae bacterium]
MSLELLDARETGDGIAVTFATDGGIETLEGTRAQIARLSQVMAQVAALAALNEDERVWIERVVVGDAVVHLGLKPGGQAKVRIVRPRIAAD